MPDAPIHVLLVEDNPGDAALIREYLSERLDMVIELHGADCLAEARQLLRRISIDVVLVDLALPASDGLDTFRDLHEVAAQTPMVVITGLDDESVGLAAVRQGAQDYLVKDRIDGPSVVRALRYALERSRWRRLERALDETQAELRIARQIQEGLLPSTAPNVPGVEVGSLSQCAQIVSGDYDDFIQMPNGSIGIAVGDASGHGLGPALMTAEVRACLRSLVRVHDDTAETGDARRDQAPSE